jgi:hypothetical protein
MLTNSSEILGPLFQHQQSLNGSLAYKLEFFYYFIYKLDIFFIFRRKSGKEYAQLIVGNKNLFCFWPLDFSRNIILLICHL